MMTDSCGRCGRATRPVDTITVSGVGQRCYRCFNEEMSARVGVAFDHTPLDPIVLADHDGVPRTFEIRSMLVATGHAMRAEVVPRRERGGYRFAVLGDFEADAWELFQRLYQKMRRELAVRYIEQTEHGWQLIDGDRLAGRIEWDDDADGVTPLLVVDGKALTWDEVGRMLMSREGFTLHAEVTDSIEAVGGPLAEPGEGDEGAAFLCNACVAQHGCGEEMLRPVVNSPRMGVCGYDGPGAPLTFGRERENVGLRIRPES